MRYWVDLNETFALTEEAKLLTFNEWETEFKIFFKSVNDKYENFELESFFHVMREGRINLMLMFSCETDEKWDMSDSIDLTTAFYGELHGNDDSVGRLFGGGFGNTTLGNFEEWELYSELPPIFHEKYVLGTR